MSVKNFKGANILSDKFVSSLEKKDLKPLPTTPQNKVKTIHISSLSELGPIGFTHVGTGVVKDAKHHLWNVEKTSDGYSLIRNAEEDSDDVNTQKVSEEEKKLDHKEEEAHRRRKESAGPKSTGTLKNVPKKCKDCGETKSLGQFYNDEICWDCADEAGENASKNSSKESHCGLPNCPDEKSAAGDESFSDHVRRLRDQALEYFSIQTQIIPDEEDILNDVVIAIEEESGQSVDAETYEYISIILFGDDETADAEAQDDWDKTGKQAAELWANYEKAWETLSPKIKTFMEKLSQEFEGAEIHKDIGDESGWSFLVGSPDDENSIHVTLSLVDSGDADDGIYGEHGNVSFNIVKISGEIVGGLIPYNYSDNVWVDYDNINELEDRLDMIAQDPESIVDLIEENLGKKESAKTALVNPALEKSPEDKEEIETNWGELPQQPLTEEEAEEFYEKAEDRDVLEGPQEKPYKLEKDETEAEKKLPKAPKANRTMTAGDYQDALPKMRDFWDNVFDENDKHDFLEMTGGSELDIDKKFDELPLSIQDALTASYFDVHQDIGEPSEEDVYENIGYEAPKAVSPHGIHSSNKEAITKKQADSEMHTYGFEEGQNAAEVNYDLDPEECKEKFESDDISSVASQVLEHQQQMEGTVYYQDHSDEELDEWEEGFYEGFADRIEDLLMEKEGYAGQEQDLFLRDYQPGEIKESNEKE